GMRLHKEGGLTGCTARLRDEVPGLTKPVHPVIDGFDAADINVDRSRGNRAEPAIKLRPATIVDKRCGIAFVDRVREHQWNQILEEPDFPDPLGPGSLAQHGNLLPTLLKQA